MDDWCTWVHTGHTTYVEVRGHPRSLCSSSTLFWGRISGLFRYVTRLSGLQAYTFYLRSHLRKGARGLLTYDHTELSMVPRIWAKVHTFVFQALYSLSHLPSPISNNSHKSWSTIYKTSTYFLSNFLSLYSTPLLNASKDNILYLCIFKMLINSPIVFHPKP